MTPRTAKARIESLALVHRACWDELARIPRDKAHPWRLMGLATVDGDLPALRNVVIREVDAPGRALLFFTDARSPKVAQIARAPRGMLLAWSAALGWQLRLQVALGVQTSGLAVSSRWARLKMTPGAHDYLSPLPPGTPVERYEPERATREHFAVVTAQVLGIDWLELHADGHRRARFDAQGDGQWLTP